MKVYVARTENWEAEPDIEVFDTFEKARTFLEKKRADYIQERIETGETVEDFNKENLNFELDEPDKYFYQYNYLLSLYTFAIHVCEIK